MNQAPQRNYMDKRSTGLATASIALGIVSIVTFCCLYAALPCGALAIILGLLSRGGEMTFSTTGKIGIVLGIIGPVSYTHLDVYKRQLPGIAVAGNIMVHPECMDGISL